MSSDAAIARVYMDRWAEFDGQREGVIWTARLTMSSKTSAHLSVRSSGQEIVTPLEAQRRIRLALAYSGAQDFAIPPEQAERVLRGMTFPEFIDPPAARQ